MDKGTEQVWNAQPNWKTKPFTYHYSQPSEYRYSLDSIEFMWKLGKILRANDQLKDLRVLDLCSECGVLGFELNYWIPEKINSIDFIEIQPEYEKHFKLNLEITNNQSKNFNFHRMNFNELPAQNSFNQDFDVIVCNPPYFRSQTAILSSSDFRKRCHFLLDGNFSELCASLFYSLAPTGEAYVLLKDLTAQGVDQLQELKHFAGAEFAVDVLGRIRGIPVVRITKNKSPA